ncbi:transcription factor KUA1-like [Mercurialis annua]|uniref:transcription factor KUA1-like n=1 Tax=Mercurialis annua TaxID=3986 RepID=UPI002160B06C|nr:transcription factor KUA1-like [Mercurialis annua]
MGRKCSKCGEVGHNSRTCKFQLKESKSLKLFGVKLDINNSSSEFSLMNNGFSTVDCLSSSPSSSSCSSVLIATVSSKSSSLMTIQENADIKFSGRYLSNERKKGLAWTAEEHQIFLVGLKKLGKGDWRGISRNFVTTRTPTQVASHAQKFFLRLNSFHKTKRRHSLFDMGSFRSSIYEPNERSFLSGLALKISSEAASASRSYSTELGLKNGSRFPNNDPLIGSEPTCFDGYGQCAAPDLELKLAAPISSDQTKKYVLVT